MPMNLALKFALIESGKKQIVVANEIGIDESTLSKIVNGHMDASDDVKRSLAKVLRKKVDQLFPEAVAS